MATIFVFVGIALIICVGYRLYQHLFPPPNINPKGKYVLISGCDSGFGHALAIDLDKKGFHVLAGVFNPDTKARLINQLSNQATVFHLDITQENDIDAAYDLVRQKTNTLHALINNAGIASLGLLDWTSMDSMRKTMDVNLFGHIAMTKKFLPLLIHQRWSRVINVSSAAGYLAGPGFLSYSCSKFAVEAFSDALRREMHTWGLHVCLIEPAYMRTPIIEACEFECRNLWNGLADDIKNRWGEKFFNSYIKQLEKDPFILNAENPQKVIKAIRHATMSTVPCIRYRPGWQSSLFFFPLSMVPAWISDHILKLRTVHDPPLGLINQMS